MAFVPGLERALGTYSFARKEPLSVASATRLFTGVRMLDIDPAKSIAADRVKQLESYIAERNIPTLKRQKIRQMLLEAEDL